MLARNVLAGATWGTTAQCKPTAVWAELHAQVQACEALVHAQQGGVPGLKEQVVEI